MSFRFVHAADIHLDSPLRSLALRDPALAELIGNATRRAFEAVIRLCLDERVDALLLAGDLYDREQTSMKTARFLGDQLRPLHEAGIGVFIVRGNHDAMSRITRELSFPDTVTIFGGRPAPFAVAREGAAFPVTVHGVSFAQPHAPTSLLHHYRPAAEAVNIGIMHTSLDGSPDHDHYAPCALADLERSGFAYWALGHIHRRAVHAGAATVVMPGMPQGRDIGEAGPKSVTLVTIADDRSVAIEERPTSVAQFERVGVDLGGVEDWRGMVARLARARGETRDRVRSEHLVARLRLTGATPLAWRLRRDPDLLLEEAASQAASLGRCWIDKVEVACRAPEAGANPDAGDALDELGRLMGQDVLVSEAYRAEIEAIAREVQALLPAECRDALGGTPEALAAAAAVAAREGIEDVLAFLHPAEAVEAG